MALISNGQHCNRHCHASVTNLELSWLSYSVLCLSKCLISHAEIGPGFYHTYVIGDFEPKEARDFVDFELGKIGKPFILDADWDVVHKVCVLLHVVSLHCSGTERTCTTVSCYL